MDDLVAYEGGPNDGWWLTAADHATRAEAARNMGRGPGDACGAATGYRRTTRTTGHPNPAGLTRAKAKKGTPITAVVYEWVGDPQP